MIRLGQLLELAGIVEVGGEVRVFLAEATILVNGEPELGGAGSSTRATRCGVNDLELRVARGPAQQPSRTIH